MTGNGFEQELTRLGPEQSRTFTLPQARRYCGRLARQHYENFSVASILLPRRLLPHFHAIYAYCRWADDLGDETGGGQRALDLLQWWREELLRCYQGQPRHPVMVALRATIQRFRIPPQPFLELLLAFEQDQRVKRYGTFAELLEYCRHSANPVGRLVLYLCECHDAERAALSDHICTGLQLANFWQDVARDLDIGRVYLPEEDRQHFGYPDTDLEGRRFTPAFAELLRFEVERARELFRQGMPLVARMPAEVRGDIELFARGGLAILDKIEERGFDVWSARPSLSKWEKARLVGGVWLQEISPDLTNSRGASSPNGQSLVCLPTLPSLGHSYALCERLARREAANFYHAFRLLPACQRRAMCALYAFLRITDDIADGPADVKVKEWALADWRRALDAALSDRCAHPVHPALADTVRTFQIPPQYLHDVLDGVAMDLYPVCMATFAELDRYCYRVASAVGLACIHIWGFEQPAAAKLHAEKAGIAFQLTNILRDLSEDAARDRIYLPAEDLNRFGYTREDLLRGELSERFRDLMAFQVERARRFYAEGEKLEPLLSPQGRAVFRVMLRTYRALLDAIEARGYDVFQGRVRVGGWRKAGLVLQALPVRWGWL